MRKSIVFLFAALTIVYSSAMAESQQPGMVSTTRSDTRSDAAALAEEFRDPPLSSRPGAYWNWLNGNVDRERLKYELHEMKAKGMGAAEIWDVAAIRNSEMVPAGPSFLSPESAASIRFALAEGKKLGLRMGMVTSSGWNAGGSWVDPSWASKTLVSSSVGVTGGKQIELELPLPELPKDCPVGEDGKPLFLLDVGVVAVPANAEKRIDNINRVLVLTDYFSEGKLKWDVPEGEWQVLRFVCTNTGQQMIVPSPNSNGLFIDFLDPEATRRHLQTIMDRLEITPENAEESGLDYMEVDSMEMYPGHPWTDRFVDYFYEERSYDPAPWMPVLEGWTVQDEELSARFVYDYRKTVSDLLIHSHYETGSAFLAEYGMELVGEAGGPGPPIWDTCPVDALKALGNVHVPRGEFWIQHRNMFLIKEVASAAHIYGKQIVDAESFTTWRRWEDSPFILKLSADRAFAEGLNQLTIHGFAHSPDHAGLPGWTYHAGVDINPNTTWWPQARPFMDYLARCSHMLRQGNPVADVLWYYGDQAPNFFPAHHDVPNKPRIPGLGTGYDYDVVDSHVILHRLKVENGRFVLPEGTSYAVLAIPKEAAIPLEVMEKIEFLVKQGGVIAGPKPTQTPGLLNWETRTEKIKAIADRLWSEGESVRKNGEGKVHSSESLDEVLKRENITPDFSVAEWDSKPHIDYIHRRTPDAEIYFIRNEAMTPETITATFRVRGKTPELWAPDTGKRMACRVFRQEDSGIEVDLTLESGEATFVVFREGALAPTPEETTELTYPLVLAKPWSLEFQKDRGGPGEPMDLNELQSWTAFEPVDVAYYSGTGTYTVEFTVAEGELEDAKEVFLDLGEVYDVAEVELNGQDAGTFWKPPYRVEAAPLIKPGLNSLSVRVTNLWHNRRVGDSKADPAVRVTRTNQPLPSKDAAPLPSGLIGPVKIVVRK